MIDREIFVNDFGTELCRTYSTENRKIRQVETNITYGSSVIDVIKGYDGDKPYSRFSYTETEETDDLSD